MTNKYTDFILRGALAFAFLYPPLNAISDPYAWIGYFPSFVKDIVSDQILLHSFGVLEVTLALWILSGWRIFWPSLMTFVMLTVIVFFNMSQFQVLFRDLSIAAIALALALESYPKRSS